MKISSITVQSYGTGNMTITLDDDTIIAVGLTAEEADRVKAIGIEIFQSRQQAIANTISNASIKALVDLRAEPAPPVYDPFDDVPF